MSTTESAMRNAYVADKLSHLELRSMNQRIELSEALRQLGNHWDEFRCSGDVGWLSRSLRDVGVRILRTVVSTYPSVSQIEACTLVKVVFIEGMRRQGMSCHGDEGLRAQYKAYFRGLRAMEEAEGVRPELRLVNSDSGLGVEL